MENVLKVYIICKNEKQSSRLKEIKTLFFKSKIKDLIMKDYLF